MGTETRAIALLFLLVAVLVIIYVMTNGNDAPTRVGW